jgi:hypothetical protein
VLISRRAGALPPDKAAVGCIRNAARKSAADHLAGPHASARMVYRAVIMLLNASAPALRRMISLRAWLTTRPGRPISRKRNAFIRFVAQFLPGTSRFIAAFKLCARIIRVHHAALAPILTGWQLPTSQVALHCRMDFLALAAGLAQPPNHPIAGLIAVGHHAEQLVGPLGADLLLQVRCAVYNGTLGSGLGHRFQPHANQNERLANAA